MEKITITPEDYVSYPIALALKKAGFDWPCDHCYLISKDTNTYVGIAEYPAKQKWNSAKIGGPAYLYKHLSAPTLWQAQKWLREKKRMDVTVYAQPYNGLPYYTGFIIFDGDEKEVLDQDGHWFDDYERCLSETIAAALEL